VSQTRKGAKGARAPVPPLTMSSVDRRTSGLDRRRVPRGGRRGTDRPGRHPPVLIADSYDGVRRPCSRYLDRFHFAVTEVASGDEALASIVASPPRIIMTELDLPTMPAARLLQWLGQSWRTRDIPVLVLASVVEPAMDETFRLAAGVLVKPFALRHMLDEIRRVIRAHEIG
jgi:DNA-binding response OmpR family regulator